MDDSAVEYRQRIERLLELEHSIAPEHAQKMTKRHADVLAEAIMSNTRNIHAVAMAIVMAEERIGAKAARRMIKLDRLQGIVGQIAPGIEASLVGMGVGHYSIFLKFPVESTPDNPLDTCHYVECRSTESPRWIVGKVLDALVSMRDYAAKNSISMPLNQDHLEAARRWSDDDVAHCFYSQPEAR